MTTTMSGDQRKGDLAKLARGYYNANGIKDPNVLKAVQAITQNQEYFKRKFGRFPDFEKLMRKLNLNSAEFEHDLTLEPEDKELTPPQVVLISAEWDGNTSADIVGKVNPASKSTSYYFRYKNEDDLSWTNVTAGSAGDGDIPVEVTTTLTGLTPAKTYYVQLIAQNSDGTVLSNILTFVTGAAPEVDILYIVDITATTAIFKGTVDPNSLETSYHWAYGRTLAYELGTTPVSAGAGASAVDVSADITGLQFDTLYYVKLVGTNTGGTDTDKTTFRTKKADVPEVEITADTFRTDISTKLNGTVDPNGFETTYYFEYGINNTYIGPNTPMPATPASAGSGTSPVSVNADITGLIPGTLYHARLVATNAYGTVYSGDLPIAIPIAELSLTGDLAFGTIYDNDTGNVDKTAVVGNVALGTSTARWSASLTGDASLIGNLNVIPPTGEVLNGNTQNVIIQLDRAGFVVGTYSATLIVTDQYAPDPVTLPIALEVIPSVPNVCPYIAAPPQPAPLSLAHTNDLYGHYPSPSVMGSVSSCNWRCGSQLDASWINLGLVVANSGMTTYEPWGDPAGLASAQASAIYPNWSIQVTLTAFGTQYTIAYYTKDIGGDPNGAYALRWASPSFEVLGGMTVTGA